MRVDLRAAVFQKHAHVPEIGQHRLAVPGKRGIRSCRQVRANLRSVLVQGIHRKDVAEEHPG